MIEIKILISAALKMEKDKKSFPHKQLAVLLEDTQILWLRIK